MHGFPCGNLNSISQSSYSNRDGDQRVDDQTYRDFRSTKQDIQRCRVLIESINTEIQFLKHSTTELAAKIVDQTADISNLKSMQNDPLITIDGESSAAQFSDPVDRWIAAFVMMNPYAGVSIVKTGTHTYDVGDGRIVSMQLPPGAPEPLITSSISSFPVSFSSFFNLFPPNLISNAHQYYPTSTSLPPVALSPKNVPALIKSPFKPQFHSLSTQGPASSMSPTHETDLKVPANLFIPKARGQGGAILTSAPSSPPSDLAVLHEATNARLLQPQVKNNFTHKSHPAFSLNSTAMNSIHLSPNSTTYLSPLARENFNEEERFEKDQRLSSIGGFKCYNEKLIHHPRDPNVISTTSNFPPMFVSVNPRSSPFDTLLLNHPQKSNAATTEFHSNEHQYMHFQAKDERKSSPFSTTATTVDPSSPYFTAQSGPWMEAQTSNKNIAAVSTRMPKWTKKLENSNETSTKKRLDGKSLSPVSIKPKKQNKSSQNSSPSIKVSKYKNKSLDDVTNKSNKTNETKLSKLSKSLSLNAHVSPKGQASSLDSKKKKNRSNAHPQPTSPERPKKSLKNYKKAI